MSTCERCHSEMAAQMLVIDRSKIIVNLLDLRERSFLFFNRRIFWFYSVLQLNQLEALHLQ